MSAVFVSYDRESRVLTDELVADIKLLGHRVWRDDELAGGQVWWDKILGAIRDCDVFVFVLTPRSLRSIACQRERDYAAALRKAILPIQAADGVSTNLLPPNLANLQIVDYRSRDRDAAFRLGRAFLALPPPLPLPDTMPDPPEVPRSYLGGLAQRVVAVDSLSYEQQSTLLLDLKESLRNPETAEDARSLLRQLSERRDVLASVAREVDALLASPRPIPQRVGPPTDRLDSPSELSLLHPVPPEPTIRPRGLTPTPRKRLSGALVGFVLGTVLLGYVGYLGMRAKDIEPKDLPVMLLFVVPFAVAGAIAGNRKIVILLAVVGAFVGFAAVTWSASNAPVMIRAALGGCPGVILGALAGTLYWRLDRSGYLDGKR